MIVRILQCIFLILILALSVLLLPLELLSILFGALAIATIGIDRAKQHGAFWAAWGNSEDPIPPTWFMSESFSTWGRTFSWYLRNGHHNFQWHVIGVHGKPFTRTGDYPDQVWNPNGGRNFAVIRYGWLILPFVSYRGKSIEGYVGWRESGAFGRALRKAHAK